MHRCSKAADPALPCLLPLVGGNVKHARDSQNGILPV